MAWRSAVNGVIKQLTGYQLTRVPVPAPRQAARAPESARPAPAPKPKPSPKPKGLVLPEDYDDEAKDIIRAVKPYTMTSPERLNAFILATRHVSRHGIPGAIVECGVWRGGSMQAVRQGPARRPATRAATSTSSTPTRA